MMLKPVDYVGYLKGWQVLVVDDERDSLEVAGAFLKLAGAIVFTARDGGEGYELARQHRPLFILSDLSMPGIDGWQMVKMLDEDPTTHHIPVIALTAHAMQGDRDRAVAAGFHNYLVKPLKPETFVYDLLRLLVDIPGLAGEMKRQPCKHPLE